MAIPLLTKASPQNFDRKEAVLHHIGLNLPLQAGVGFFVFP